MSSSSAAVKVTVPGQSIRPACGWRDSGSSGVSASTATAASAGAAKTARQPNAEISRPAMEGPKARPTPMVVPKMLNTRARDRPGKAWASRAEALVAAAAAPTPASARSRSSSTMFPATEASSPEPAKIATPVAKTRRRPSRSASAPVASMKLAKVAL